MSAGPRRWALAVVFSVGGVAVSQAEVPEAIDIGSRRQLFLDRFLIERMEGDERTFCWIRVA